MRNPTARHLDLKHLSFLHLFLLVLDLLAGEQLIIHVSSLGAVHVLVWVQPCLLLSS